MTVLHHAATSVTATRSITKQPSFENLPSDVMLFESYESRPRQIVMRAIAAAAALYLLPPGQLAAASNSDAAFSRYQPDVSPQEPFEQRAEHVADVREIYGIVKAVFGLTVSDTARLFGVTRKTLHGWLSADAPPSPHRKHLSRALALERISRRAMDKLSAPVGTDAMIQLNDVTIFDLAESTQFSEAAFDSWIDALARRRQALATKPDLVARLRSSGMASPPGSDLDPLI